MARLSSIDRLPDELRDWIARLRQQGRTIDEIMMKLRELDSETIVSRSALGRHIKKADEVAQKIREKRLIAQAIGRDIDGASDSQLARANVEIMHSILMTVATAEDDGEPVTFDPKDVMALAKALDHLGKASKDDVARTVAVEKRAAEKAKAEAMKAASTAVEAAGGGPIDGAALLRKIREQVYGIGEGPG